MRRRRNRPPWLADAMLYGSAQLVELAELIVIAAVAGAAFGVANTLTTWWLQ